MKTTLQYHVIQLCPLQMLCNMCVRIYAHLSHQPKYAITANIVLSKELLCSCLTCGNKRTCPLHEINLKVCEITLACEALPLLQLSDEFSFERVCRL